jgi:hypothetical protein
MMFWAADGWPSRRADPKTRALAVKALVANHTLIVGQSRSGKTNAARRLAEEILGWTETRVVILDPNADFRYLAQLAPGKPRISPGASDPDKEYWEAQFRTAWPRVCRGIQIATPEDGAPWGIPWKKLILHEIAAFLKVTPKDNFGEYRQLVRHCVELTRLSGGRRACG